MLLYGEVLSYLIVYSARFTVLSYNILDILNIMLLLCSIAVYGLVF